MAIKKKARKAITPLVVEDHPDNYNGYPFITLLQHQHNHVLTIVDNYDNKRISAYVLDLCNPEDVSEQHIIELAANWYDNSDGRYPLSIEFSKLDLIHVTSKIYKTFNTDFITRVIGPLPKFPMDGIKKIKRRKRKPIPDSLFENCDNVVNIMD